MQRHYKPGIKQNKFECLAGENDYRIHKPNGIICFGVLNTNANRTYVTHFIGLSGFLMRN